MKASGEMGDGEALVRLEADGPLADGPTVDAQGCLWIAAGARAASSPSRRGARSSTVSICPSRTPRAARLAATRSTGREFDGYGATAWTLGAFTESHQELLATVRDIVLPDPDKRSA